MMGSSQILFCGSITFCLLSMNVFLSISIPLPIPQASTETKCTGSRQYFHNETQKCYKEKTKGPCSGENMIFLKLDKIFGDCDCTDKGYLPWVYNPDTDSCYKAYQQSYCSEGKWLIFDEQKNPSCVVNQCLKVTTEDEEENPVVIFKDKCVHLNTPSELCPNASGDVVKILQTEVTPECISNLHNYSVLKTNSLRCKPGSRRDRNGTCRRTAVAVAATMMDDSEN